MNTQYLLVTAPRPSHPRADLGGWGHWLPGPLAAGGVRPVGALEIRGRGRGVRSGYFFPSSLQLCSSCVPGPQGTAPSRGHLRMTHCQFQNPGTCLRRTDRCPLPEGLAHVPSSGCRRLPALLFSLAVVKVLQPGWSALHRRVTFTTKSKGTICLQRGGAHSPRLKSGPSSWLERVIIIKTPLAPRPVSKFNAIPIKIARGCFLNLELS